MLGGCGPAQRKEEVANTEIDYDYSKVRVGEAVLYKLQGPGRSGFYKIAAVGRRVADLWIEQKYPGGTADTPTFIIKTLFGPDGKALELWGGQPGGIPSKVTAPPEKERRRPRVLATAEDVTEILGRPYACTRVTLSLERPGRRPLVVVDWCSEEVPFPVLHEGKSYGGLLRRVVQDESGDLELQLFQILRDATPELEVPE